MDLEKYIEDHGIALKAFSRKAGVAVGTLYNIFRGKGISLEVAMKIEVQTRGFVTCQDIHKSIMTHRDELKNNKESKNKKRKERNTK